MNEITITATLDNIGVVSEFMEAETEPMGASMKVVMQLNVVIDELLSNIIRYGYPETTGSATIRIYEQDGYIVIVFLDHGIPYNPLEKEDPDITIRVEDREIGGLGIFMAKKLTDRMEYRYEDGQNILTVWKKIV